jgi:hypothetical protein
MDPLNLNCFSQPHWRVIARGFDTETWFEEGQADGTGGIMRPEPENLRVGQKYFRFASSASSREAQLGGGWWVDYDNFAMIRRVANEQDVTLTYAARLFLALPYVGTRVDRLVSAILEVPLRAYAGRGKVALAGGETWTPAQHIQVKQLYIPGLYKPGAQPQLFEKAFPDPRTDYAATLNRVS